MKNSQLCLLIANVWGAVPGPGHTAVALLFLSLTIVWGAVEHVGREHP